MGKSWTNTERYISRKLITWNAPLPLSFHPDYTVDARLYIWRFNAGFLHIENTSSFIDIPVVSWPVYLQIWGWLSVHFQPQFTFQESVQLWITIVVLDVRMCNTWTGIKLDLVWDSFYDFDRRQSYSIPFCLDMGNLLCPVFN